MRHAAMGQWGGGMDLQGSIRQANSLRRVGALFATRTGTLWPNARNGTVRNVAKEDTRSTIAHIHSRRGVFQATTQHGVVHETAVVVPVKWNGGFFPIGLFCR